MIRDKNHLFFYANNNNRSEIFHLENVYICSLCGREDFQLLKYPSLHTNYF